MTESSEMLVRDIMVSQPVTVEAVTTVATAAQLMGEKNIGAVVVTHHGRVVGMFTERDLLRRAVTARHNWDHTPVEQFMTAQPVTVQPDLPWAQAMSIMDQRRIRHLPVVESGRAVGMVSVRDLLHHRTEYLEALVRERTTELALRNQVLTERDQQLTRDLKVAAKIQKRLMPEKLPDFKPFRFAVAFHGHDQVTGDYYDFIPIGLDRLGVLIADASGHGVPAAFVSVMARMCCSAYCQNIESPAAILRAMNANLGDLIEAEHFITMFAAVVNRRTLDLAYSRAGHPQPLLYRAQSRQVSALDASGVMIGVCEGPDYADEHVHLQRGDKLLLYTDGVSECRSVDDQILGVEVLKSFLTREGHLPCEDLLRALESEVDRFRGHRAFNDDVTVIVIETE